MRKQPNENPIREGLDRHLAKRRWEREALSRPQLEEIGQTEFVEETAANAITIIGALAGKPVELEITDLSETDQVRQLRHHDKLFRLEEASGGWLIWIGSLWLPLSASQIIRRGSIAYRLEAEEWWAWSLAWLDRSISWSVSLLDRSRCPAALDELGLSLFDAEIVTSR